MRRRARVAQKAILLLALGVALLGCVSASNEPKRVRGLVVDVEASSASQLASFELQSTNGSRIRFHVDGDVGITPGHTREHMLGAEPVTVTYRDTPRGAQALRVDDQRRMHSFNERVYALVRRVPHGRVITYGAVARHLGAPGKAREVGWAMHNCPDDVPAHRVVNRHGEVTGDSLVDNATLRRLLLEDEGIEFDAAGRCDMRRHAWEPSA